MKWRTGNCNGIIWCLWKTFSVIWMVLIAREWANHTNFYSIDKQAYMLCLAHSSITLLCTFIWFLLWFIYRWLTCRIIVNCIPFFLSVSITLIHKQNKIKNVKKKGSLSNFIGYIYITVTYTATKSYLSNHLF